MQYKSKIRIIKCFILILILEMTGCQPATKNKIIDKNDSQKQTSQIYSINFEEVIGTKKEVTLSKFTEIIKYVPLETVSGSILNTIRKIVIFKSFIYVSDHEKLLKFSINGKFIKQIGSIGRGPGEYLGLGNFGINVNLGFVIIFDAKSQKILWYDTDGNFIKSINRNLNGSQFVFFEKNRIAIHSSEFLNQSDSIINNLIITDENFNTINRIPAKTQRKGKWSLGYAPLFFYGTKLCYKETFNDTLYQLYNNQLKPYAIFELGSHQLPANFKLPVNQGIAKLREATEEVEDKLNINCIVESRRYFFTQLLYGIRTHLNEPLFILFDKKRNISKAINGTGLTNDIDHGVPFWPKFVSNDTIFIDYEDAYVLKMKVLENQSTLTLQDKKNKLLELANSLTENDNPVLMLVKLKD